MNVFTGITKQLLTALAGVMLLVLSGCETAEKVLKSNNVDYKIKKANHWYDKKEYFKCIPVFEELMGLLKGTKSTEDIYYKYCYANYRQGDYMISAYHFKNFTNLYPNSEKAEECGFMQARSYDKLSPKFELDQTYTYKAIDAYQDFINNYPESTRVDTANILMSRLRKKLERKALYNAELYYKTQNYRAAATSFENLLVQYPDNDNVERIMYMIVKSNRKFAENSIVSKRVERYHNVISAYKNFRYKYPSSKYDAELKAYEKEAHFQSVVAAYEHAEIEMPSERERLFVAAVKEAQQQLPYITDPKEQINCQEYIEKSYYGIVKNNFEMAEEFDTDSLRKIDNKINLYDRTIKSYYTFVDKYKNSRYIKEAEKIFATCTEKITKLKQYGQKQEN